MANLARTASRNQQFKRWVDGQFQGSAILAESWLRFHFHYRDEVEEIIRTPEFMMQDFEQFGYVEGDCDDITTLTAAITKAQGWPTRLTAIQSQSQTEFDHVFPEIRVETNWYPIDITVPPGTDYNRFSEVSEWV